MQLKYGLISVDDHVQEPPDLWTDRLSKSRWGERIPHLERTADGAERWVVDGKVLLDGVAAQSRRFDGGSQHRAQPLGGGPTGGLLARRAAESDGQRRRGLFSALSDGGGLSGRDVRADRRHRTRAGLRAGVQRLADRELGGASERFIPQCIVPDLAG